MLICKITGKEVSEEEMSSNGQYSKKAWSHYIALRKQIKNRGKTITMKLYRKYMGYPPLSTSNCALITKEEVEDCLLFLVDEDVA